MKVDLFTIKNNWESFGMNWKKLWSFIPVRLTAGILCCALLSGCAGLHGKKKELRATGFYFDTVITVTLYENGSQQLLDECMELAGYYEQLLSATVEGSDVWRINHSGGQPVTVDQDTLTVLETALFYAELSEGAVDPTIGSLSSLWNFGSQQKEIVPSPTSIEEALSHVDYRLLSLEGRQVTLKDPQARIDLGFIAKGFIGDQIREFLLSKGVSSALINLGGNVVAIGCRPDGSPFRIGIQKPFAAAGTPALTLDLSQTSVVSSGNYERYFIKDGQLYHHILSPHTGYPAQSGLSQVTILSASSVDGDALSTLCFILGCEKAARLLENYPDIQAVFITEDGDIRSVHFDQEPSLR